MILRGQLRGKIGRCHSARLYGRVFFCPIASSFSAISRLRRSNLQKEHFQKISALRAEIF
jgi:hypothetical protein